MNKYSFRRFQNRTDAVTVDTSILIIRQDLELMGAALEEMEKIEGLDENGVEKIVNAQADVLNADDNLRFASNHIISDKE